jgi:hypothetical protein
VAGGATVAAGQPGRSLEKEKKDKKGDNDRDDSKIFFNIIQVEYLRDVANSSATYPILKTTIKACVGNPEWDALMRAQLADKALEGKGTACSVTRTSDFGPFFLGPRVV